MHTDRPERRNRRSVRLKGYDYAGAGAYFVTICVQNRECLFGRIADGQMVLNDAGMMIQTVWNEIPPHYPGIEIDASVVMPNHIHGIIVIVGAAPRGRPVDGQPQGVAPTLSLPDVVHRFKTMTTKRYADGVKQYGWRRFNGKLWQRNYYEHIIRSDDELNSIREYIAINPAQWALDRENPDIGPAAASQGVPDAGGTACRALEWEGRR